MSARLRYLDRREILNAGAISFLGGALNLPSLLAAEQAGLRRPTARAKSVLFLYLQGGPATQDMFDLKPDAPAGIRSEFRPIPTSASGISVCEHLPKMARWMHKTAIVRTVHHSGGCHNNLPMYTGYDVPPPDIDSARDTDPPSMGSVVLYNDHTLELKPATALPGYIFVPCPLGWGEVKRKPGPGGGFLGHQYDPLTTECTAYTDRPMKKSDDLQVVRGEPILKDVALGKGLTVPRLTDRANLRDQLDARLRSEAGRRPQQLAFEMVTSPQVREGFDLNREPQAVRDRYGRSLFGQATLLGRRLIERGVRFVNVSWDNMRERFEFPPSNQVWDTHERNFPILKDNHLPQLDLTWFFRLSCG